MKNLLGIFVPFQFDLGGPIRFNKDMLRRLAGFGDWEISQAKSRSFNTSYLSRHSPILRVALEPIRVETVQISWDVARWLLVYPWLGTVSLNYYFQPADHSPEPGPLLQFYDELVDLIDDDYLPYLFRHNQMENLGVRLKTDYHEQGRRRPSRLHMGDTIDRLRQTLDPDVSRRPATYWFMNFRMMYLWSLQSSEVPDLSLVRALLDLRRTPASRAVEIGPDLVSELADVWSNGWVTAVSVNSAHEDEQAVTVDNMREAFSLCHAQWFLCQIWISIYAEIVGDKETQELSRAEVEGFTQNLYSLERDLAEAANLDVMLRDPLRIQLSHLFLDRLGVVQHLEEARRRLTLLTQFLRGHLEIQTSRDAARLQLLFSFSAAAAIAALIPPIWPLWPVKVLGWVVLLLSLSLLLAFSGPPQGVARALEYFRSTARKGKSAPKAGEGEGT
jgi:hypothetical protein